jgi:two-component system, cell cycle sensor histidine kinase and response regulator CckA
MQKIFEPFFTTKDVGKGTGLGLATVYGIVKQHRGWIEVESEPGNGATFSIFIPAVRQKSVTNHLVEDARPTVGTETVLLVEDEDIVRSMAALILREQGYQVLEAASGQDALRLWASHSGTIHLLLTDIVMPGNLNGRELAEKLRMTKPGLKVVYASGYNPEMSASLFPHERSAFLQKPYHPRKLTAIVRQLLDQDLAVC